jgi:hypothetical protein
VSDHYNDAVRLDYRGEHNTAIVHAILAVHDKLCELQTIGEALLDQQAQQAEPRRVISDLAADHEDGAS